MVAGLHQSGMEHVHEDTLRILVNTFTEEAVLYFRSYKDAFGAYTWGYFDRTMKSEHFFFEKKVTPAPQSENHEPEESLGE